MVVSFIGWEVVRGRGSVLFCVILEVKIRVMVGILDNRF